MQACQSADASKRAARPCRRTCSPERAKGRSPIENSPWVCAHCTNLFLCSFGKKQYKFSKKVNNAHYNCVKCSSKKIIYEKLKKIAQNFKKALYKMQNQWYNGIGSVYFLVSAVAYGQNEKVWGGRSARKI
ncbi:MAG TPA: hypothetical protein H9851_00635 [Candidatus Borkfalkia faecavium]|uniref:Uncharacterized protein n=1 Tax=Candidatus Borkfalkia faecavium TaxID=2838508 RepID=A0A9D2ATJ7_9FIRM|nr:hypothetical protein [Candidatus Borkfalkia faecavium]